MTKNSFWQSDNKTSYQYQILEDVEIHDTDLQIPDSKPTSNDFFEDIDVLKVENQIDIISDNDDVWKTCFRDPDKFSSNYILDILTSSYEGKAILDVGEKTEGSLDNSLRNRLSKLLVTHHLETDPNKKISRKEFTKWSFEIKSLFPKESPSTYYSSYTPGDKYNRKNASGKLYDCYINKRRILRKKGEIPLVRTGLKSKCTPCASRNFTPPKVPVTPKDIDKSQLEEKLEFIQKPKEHWQWNLVEKYWRETSHFRLAKIINQEGNITEYFNKYPVLKQQNGYNLLLEDFNIIYGPKKNSLVRSITLYKNTIVEMAKLKYSSIRGRETKNAMKMYLEAIDENAETQINGVLMLLPFLTPLTSSISNWRLSRTDVREAFIIQVSTEAEMHASVSSRKEKLSKLGRSLLPMIYFIGESIAKINSVFIVFDEAFYKVPTLLSAVDKAFKIFHATGIKYPEEADNVWMLIQKGFYAIKTKHDRESACINSLMVDIGIGV